MRVTISHDRSKAEVIDAIDRGFDEALKEAANLPGQIEVKEKQWHGSTLNFALKAKRGMLGTTIKGTAEVTDSDLTIDADLGMLSRFVSEKTAHDMISYRIKRLLK
jgi:hypothetical protein